MSTIWPGSFQLSSKTEVMYGGISRFGGEFYWRQAANALALNATMLYNAMFDDLDDGTAMFKISASAKDIPVNNVPHTSFHFKALDDDGLSLPTDRYLTLAGKVTSALHQGQQLGQYPGAPNNWAAARIAQAVTTGYAVLHDKELPKADLCIHIDQFKS